MRQKSVKDRCCLNSECPNFGKTNLKSIIRHSMYKTGQGRRRRFLCKTCGKTFCSTKGTPYYRLHHSRSNFDNVATMTVEGVCPSSISRIKRISRNTVCRWQELASQAAQKFMTHKLNGIEMIELQADEIQSFVGKKKNQTWVFATIEVWSRLWISFVVGKRNYRNTKQLLRDTIQRCVFKKPFLFTTDGFEFYAWVAKQLLGPICAFAQVMKKRRMNRVIQVKRKVVLGSKEKVERLLFDSEDSTTINTSFIERLNLTIRQGCAYLGRRKACHPRRIEGLQQNLSLLQCHYNFMRPHLALKFGKEYRTPAMQAGLTKKKLSFRDVFEIMPLIFLWRWITLWKNGVMGRKITYWEALTTVP